MREEESNEAEIIFMINGHSVDNPDYDDEYPQDEENSPKTLVGKTIEFTKSEALSWSLDEIDRLNKKLREAAAPQPKTEEYQDEH